MPRSVSRAWGGRAVARLARARAVLGSRLTPPRAGRSHLLGGGQEVMAQSQAEADSAAEAQQIEDDRCGATAESVARGRADGLGVAGVGRAFGVSKARRPKLTMMHSTTAGMRRTRRSSCCFSGHVDTWVGRGG